MNKIFRNNNTNKFETDIIEYLNQQFLLYGFRNFSVQNVASKFHISKKTVYKRFKTKEDLIRLVLIHQLTDAYTKFVSIIQSQTNIVEKFVKLSKILEEYFSVFNEASLIRLNKYFPELADYIEQFRAHRIVPLIKLLLKLGRKQQLILDIPDEIIMRVFNSAISDIVQTKSKIGSQLPYEVLFRQSFNLLLNGILTKKGKQILKYNVEVGS